MTISQFKKIARTLKLVYAELEKEALANGISLTSDVYDKLVYNARLKVLENEGFTLEQYREAKAKVAGFSQADLVDEVEQTGDKVKEIGDRHIPTSQEIEEIAERVAQKYIVPPQITNQIIKETTHEVRIDQPKIIETVRLEKIEEKYDDKELLAKLATLESSIATLLIPDAEKIKDDLRMDIQKDISIKWQKEMPDFRKLAMGLQAQIDALGTGSSGTVGPGTINQLAYFNAASTIASLTTATYPSLTELSYVKGVTSAIQTQLDAKFTLPSLTSGSVLFSNGTTIAQDNANFFWDDTNNYLGLGVNSSLGARLQVKGTGATSSTKSLLVEDSAAADVFLVSDGGFIGVGKNFTTTTNSIFYYINTNADGSNLITLTNNTNGVSAANGFFGGEIRFAGTQEFSRASGLGIIAASVNTNASNVIVAFEGSARISSAAGRAATLIGGQFDANTNDASGGTSTTVAGVKAIAKVGTAGHTTTNAYGLWVSDFTNAGTMTNTYGIYIGDVTAGTQTNQAYGLYQVDTGARNFLAGNTGIGVAAPTRILSLKAGGSTTLAQAGGVIADFFTDAGNTDTGEDDLYSTTLAASILAVNGDKINAEYGGIFVSSATATRQLRIYFGGTLVFDTGTLTLSTSEAWTAYVSCIRVSASVVRCMTSLTTEGAALAAYTAYTEVTGLTLTNTQVLKITGEAAGVGAATNDIVAKMGSVSWSSAA